MYSTNSTNQERVQQNDGEVRPRGDTANPVVHLVVEVWRERRTADRLQQWHCGRIMHDMLMKLKMCNVSIMVW